MESRAGSDDTQCATGYGCDTGGVNECVAGSGCNENADCTIEGLPYCNTQGTGSNECTTGMESARCE